MTSPDPHPSLHDRPESGADEPYPGHEPADANGWTRCRHPQTTPQHPDNCVHSSHAAYAAVSKMTYEQYRTTRDERARHRAEFELAQALSRVAAHHGLSVEEVTARLSASPAGAGQ